MPRKRPPPPSLELSAVCKTMAVKKANSHCLTTHNEQV